MGITAGDRVVVLKGTATGKQGLVVGYVVRVDGEKYSRSYRASSVTGAVVNVTPPQITGS